MTISNSLLPVFIALMCSHSALWTLEDILDELRLDTLQAEPNFDAMKLRLYQLHQEVRATGEKIRATGARIDRNIEAIDALLRTNTPPM